MLLLAAAGLDHPTPRGALPEQPAQPLDSDPFRSADHTQERRRIEGPTNVHTGSEMIKCVPKLPSSGACHCLRRRWLLKGQQQPQRWRALCGWDARRVGRIDAVQAVPSRPIIGEKGALAKKGLFVGWIGASIIEVGLLYVGKLEAD